MPPPKLEIYEAAKRIADVLAALPEAPRAKRALLMALIATDRAGLLVDPIGISFRTVGPPSPGPAKRKEQPAPAPAEASTDVSAEPDDQG